MKILLTLFVLFFSSLVFGEEWIILQSWNDKDENFINNTYQWDFNDESWNSGIFYSFKECENKLLEEWKKRLKENFKIISHSGLFGEEIVLVINNPDASVRSQYKCLKLSN